MNDDIFDMEPVDDSFGAPPSHTEGNRTIVNEVGDDETLNFLRERVGGLETDDRGEHINVNISLENDETGASKEIGNIHSYTDEL